MLIIQLIFKLNSVKNWSVFYVKLVKFVVCGVFDVYYYRNDRKLDNKMWIIGFVDQLMVIKGVFYYEEYLQKCIVGYCFFISNVKVKNDLESLVIMKEMVLRRLWGLEGFVKVC